MSFYPIVQAGTEGGPVTSTSYTYIQELGGAVSIPYHDTISSTTATNLQTEDSTKRSKGPGNGH